MLGEVAISDAETEELLAIYDDTTTRYDGAKSGTDRRLIIVDWAVRITDFLGKHPQSPYFPGASLQLAAYHERIMNWTGVRQHAEAGWIATRDRSEPAATQIARESAFLLANALILRGDMAAYDELRAKELVLSPRATEDRWSVLQEQRNLDVRDPGGSANCGLIALSQMARIVEGPQRSINSLMAHRSGPEGVDLATLGRVGREAGLPVRAVRLASLEAFPVPSIVHVSAEHYLTVLGRQGDFYEVADPATGDVRWMIAPELAADATGVLLVDRQSKTEGVTSMRDLGDSDASLFRGRAVSWWDGLDALGPDRGFCPSHPGRGGGALESGSVKSGSTCSGCGSAGMPVWEVDEPTLNLRVTDTPLIYQPKFGPTLELTLTFNSRRRDAPAGKFLPQGRFEVGPADARYMLASSWMSWVEYDSDSELAAFVSHPGGGRHRYSFPAGVNWSDLEYWSHSRLEKVYSGTQFNGFRLHQADGRTREYLYLGLEDGTSQVYCMTSDKDSGGLGATFAYQAGTSILTQVTAADGTVFTVGYGTGSLANAIVSVTSSIGVNAYFGYDGTQAHPSGIASEGLSSITDVVGIQSFLYLVAEGTSYLRTPYGRTSLDVGSADSSAPTPVVHRRIEVSHPTGSTEAFALLRDASTVVPAWQTSQVPTPTNAVVSTLDTANRGLRNTYHWPPQVRSVMTKNLATDSLVWADLRRARTRHWLLEREGDKFQTLSWEQGASPDGTTEGAVLWYDYAGKSDPDRAGTESYPALEARAMPDGTTWYRDYTRNSLGKPLSVRERWDDGAGYPSRIETFTYSTDGVDLLTHTNALGIAELRLGYDASHRVIARTNALNEVERLGYDGSGRLIGQTNAADWRLVRTFSTDGLSVTNVAYLGASPYQTNTEVTYLNQSYTRARLNSGNLTQSTRWVVNTDPRGLVTTNIFDPLGRLWEWRSSGLAELTHYELFPGQSYSGGTGGQLILDRTALVRVVGGINYATNSWTYDARRRVTFETDPAGMITAWQYFDCDGVSQITRGHGLGLAETTSNTFNMVGWKTATAFPGFGSVSYEYDLLGRLWVTTDALGSTTNTYDNLGRWVQQRNAFGVVESRTYRLDDQVLTSTDRNGVASTNAYDSLGRIETRTLNSGVPERWFYSANFRGPTSYTNQIGKETQWTYDAAGRKTNEVVVGVMTNRFVYNGAGDLTDLYDGNQVGGANRTQWRYDAYGRVTAKVYANNQTNLTYAYDLLSRLTNRWSQAKGNTRYAYDLRGSLTNVDYASSTDLRFQFDALGRTTNMIDAAGTTRYAYANGMLVSEDGPWASDTVSYGFNNARLRSQLAIAQSVGNGWTNSYAYDSARRLTGVTSPAGTYGYQFTGPGTLVARLDQPGGFWVTNTFDGRGRLTDTTLYDNTSTILNRHGYTLNDAHQRTTITRTNYAASSYSGKVDYTYDNAGEVRTARAYNSAGTPVASENFDFGYDAGWNMLRRTNNAAVTSYTINNLNQITADGGASWGHDNNGNLTFRPRSGGYDLSYTYDDENQLVSVSSANLWKIEFTYDGRGRMRLRRDYTWSGSSWAFSTEVRYVYDGMLIVQERSSGNHPQVTYTRGTDLSGTLEGAGGIGGLLSRGAHAISSPYQMSSAAHYHADGNGNVTMLVGTGAPTIKAYYKYDPVGRTLGSSGSLVGVNAMRFSSKPVMGSSELYYYGYRFYDPSSQRWLNRDPLGEFDCGNVYSYVRNAPLGAFDLMGLFGCRPSPCADPCGEAKRLNRDMGDIGGVVCCGGKAFVCLWKSGGSTGAGKGLASEITDECARVHENAHVPDVDCSKSKDFDRGGPKPGVKNTISECKAFKAQSACLMNSIKRCDGNPQCIADVVRELKFVKLNIDQLCGAPN